MLHRFFRFVTQSLLTFLCILLLGGLLAGGWFFYQGRQLYRSAASSYPVASMYDTIRARGSYTSYDALPQTYINAVICTEDEHFMTHKGIDPGAIARALLADLRTHSLAEGGSTLTQQLAKNELFTQDKHLARKAAEMLAAFDLEKAYSKQQIFEMYANTIYFGNGCYGITQAAEGVLWQGTRPADRCRSRVSGGPAQRALALRQQPGAGPQAYPDRAQADGQVPGAHPDAGRCHRGRGCRADGLSGSPRCAFRP